MSSDSTPRKGRSRRRKAALAPLADPPAVDTNAEDPPAGPPDAGAAPAETRADAGQTSPVAPSVPPTPSALAPEPARLEPAPSASDSWPDGPPVEGAHPIAAVAPPPGSAREAEGASVAPSQDDLGPPPPPPDDLEAPDLPASARSELAAHEAPQATLAPPPVVALAPAPPVPPAQLSGGVSIGPPPEVAAAGSGERLPAPAAARARIVTRDRILQRQQLSQPHDSTLPCDRRPTDVIDRGPYTPKPQPALAESVPPRRGPTVRHPSVRPAAALPGSPLAKRGSALTVAAAILASGALVGALGWVDLLPGELRRDLVEPAKAVVVELAALVRTGDEPSPALAELEAPTGLGDGGTGASSEPESPPAPRAASHQVADPTPGDERATLGAATPVGGDLRSDTDVAWRDPAASGPPATPPDEAEAPVRVVATMGEPATATSVTSAGLGNATVPAVGASGGSLAGADAAVGSSPGRADDAARNSALAARLPFDDIPPVAAREGLPKPSDFDHVPPSSHADGPAAREAGHRSQPSSAPGDPAEATPPPSTTGAATARPPGSSPDEPDSGVRVVVIATEPPGARVHMRGEELGRTPLVIRGASTERIVFIVSRDGFSREIIQLEASSSARRIHIQMQPSSAEGTDPEPTNRPDASSPGEPST